MSLVVYSTFPSQQDIFYFHEKHNGYFISSIQFQTNIKSPLFGNFNIHNLLINFIYQMCHFAFNEWDFEKCLNCHRKALWIKRKCSIFSEWLNQIQPKTIQQNPGTSTTYLLNCKLIGCFCGSYRGIKRQTN